MNARHWMRLTAAAVVGVLLVTVNPAPSFAAPVWEVVKNGKGNRSAQPLYLTVAGSTGAAAGAAVVVNPASSSLNQQWDFEFHSGPYYIIRNRGTSDMKALSVEGNSSANGARIVQWFYQPTNKYEQWKYTGLTGGYYKYINVGTGNCLAVEGGTASTIPSGSQVILWDCGSGLDQQWNDQFI